ncbi:MAG: hypothetical protein FJ316_04300 [SAR202 cluster bacterium]|nr:hypothetical protein [SAR202 cluster bacterium]
MLGEKIGSYTGKTTSQRVLPAEGGAPRVESSFQLSGDILGVDATTIVTYVSRVRADGFLYGEGQGVVMGSGGEVATYMGSGVGRFLEGGSISIRAAIYYQTSSEKWARLNGIAVLVEHEIDPEGNAKGGYWE